MALGLCRFTNAAGGVVDWTYPGPTIDMQSPASAGAADGTVYEYYAQSLDMAQWEKGTGAYTASSGVFARTTVLSNSLGTTAKINFSKPPQIVVYDLFAAPAAVAAVRYDVAQSLTGTQEAQARLNVGAIGIVKYQIFTASGTYTPDPHLIIAWARGVAAGAGGSGITGPGASAAEGSPGGGAGSYSEKLMTPSAIGASQIVTIGAAGTAGAAGGGTGGTGGNSSIGTLMTMNGGVGGIGNGLSQGGAGGAAGTGDVTIAGANGESGKYQHLGSLNPFSGAGANSPFGAGGLAVLGNASAVPGQTGTGFGAGGSGACAQGTSATQSGGAGRPGYIVIMELCSQ